MRGSIGNPTATSSRTGGYSLYHIETGTIINVKQGYSVPLRLLTDRQNEPPENLTIARTYRLRQDHLPPTYLPNDTSQTHLVALWS